MKLKSLLPHGLVFRWEHYQKTRKKEKPSPKKLRSLNDDKVSRKERDWLWSKGFYPLEKRIYGLNQNNIDNYLDYKRYEKLHPINGKFSQLIDSKEFLPVVTNKTTNLTVSVSNGQIRYQKNPTKKPLTFGNLHTYFEEGVELACRPHGKSGGDGFEIVNSDNFNSWINKIKNSRNRYIVTEKIIQNRYASNLFSDSVNPLRIVVMREGKTRTPFIVSVSQRIGTSVSAPVSNAGKGGVIAPVDVETGVLSKGLQYVGKFAWHTHHPDSGAQIEGAQIPGWDRLIGSIMDEVERMNWLDWGGFDIAITPEGFKIIEINSLPGLVSPQILDRPLLVRPRVRKFLEQKGLEL
jgi:hypothetical protein